MAREDLRVEAIEFGDINTQSDYDSGEPITQCIPESVSKRKKRNCSACSITTSHKEEEGDGGRDPTLEAIEASIFINCWNF